nr:hypothetical protein [Tanacetum cinerariifolium]
LLLLVHLFLLPKILNIAAAPAVSIKRRKGVIIRDPEEELPSDTPAETSKVKDKGKRILIEALKPMKKKDQIEMDAEKLHKQAKEDEDLKKQLEVVDDKDDDVFIKATPIGRKVPVVDYHIVVIDNKPRYKIIMADDTHQLYISFITLLKNFDREDLEDLWRIVKARFSTSKPTNFSDDYLLSTLKTMFEKTDVQDAIWKNQQSVYGQALVKIEKRYPLSKFTLERLVNVVRLKVEEESEMLLELLRFTRHLDASSLRLKLFKDVNAIVDAKTYHCSLVGITTRGSFGAAPDLLQHGRMILESVENGPLIWPTIEENGVTRPRKYSELNPTKAIQADYDVKATNIILQVNQQPQQSEFLQLDSGLTIPVFKQGDDPIDAINHMMSFLLAVVTLAILLPITSCRICQTLGNKLPLMMED